MWTRVPKCRRPRVGDEAGSTTSSRSARASTALLTARGRNAEDGAVFRDALKSMVEGTEGGLAGLLMGFDGIAVDSYTAEGESEFDISTVGMEFSVILSQIRKAAEILGAGVSQEIAIKAEKLTTIIYAINGEYFLALALRPDGNYGKGRYLLRVTAPTLRRDLE
jgi:predicted regulator of Ras-like GTPase activity (Roadblock/LC7/MglB family)